MEAVQAGPYVFRLGLYTDPDLSPTNLGEAFDYYSAVPGWGWRAVVYQARGKWRASAIVFGVGLGETDFAPPEPEGDSEVYFPSGRLVALAEGGYAFEGGVSLPPQHLPGLGEELALWARVTDEQGTYGAQLRCRLRENAAWDAIEPEPLALEATSTSRARQEVWSPAEVQPQRGASLLYHEPERDDLPRELTEATQRALDLAAEEAQRLRREAIGPEHLLLGLIRDGNSQAARALVQVGADLRAARAAEQFLNPPAPLHATPAPALAATTSKALLLAGDEAQRLGETRIDTLHVLLGLLRQGGRAVDVLLWLGVTLSKLYHLLGRPIQP
ncbi:MAG: Clp protease N-terminal domain-containing protein [Chloroflexota bacterium]